MQNDLGRKNDELFRNVVISTFRACAKRGEAAVKALVEDLRTHAHLASEHILDLEAAEIAEAQRRANALEEDAGEPSEILLWNGPSVGCLLLDRSCTGGRLRVESNALVPDVFTLKLLTDERQQPCRVAWRKQNEIGVEFLDPM
ncbi:hypothetical protein [Methylobacterium oxalidis]|uniref:PilZ domain-containing protein n=1 Tax=Methylobacterium oxalidis TaxID=944322 RepID=A0A512JA74_9HYPH|nr:hypothetical protein [Methylobacterium oxalidis]GEP06860.1 hypothetical protein MOX02_48980 [Methylobacterium oxalidis]GJE35003.1 hypothetical protein LDDCCGHA_5220 [Methylobacterium oxalidis]GLS67578.1 hypothetical protein GCM10007888_59620 [Methylobacterium oxalidis]